jgi:hypothetical protein
VLLVLPTLVLQNTLVLPTPFSLKKELTYHGQAVQYRTDYSKGDP